MLKTILALGMYLLASCGPITDLREKLEPDLTPPALLSVRVRGEEIEFAFDEKPYCAAEDVHLTPELEITQLEVTDTRLVLQTSTQSPGQEYGVELTVADERGNSLSLMSTFYGYNPDVPRLLINEFTLRGSPEHPDLVELKAIGAGNMAGVVIYEGTPANWDDRLVFPSFPVQIGDFILVHFKPQGLSEEINESDGKNLSGGLDASELAYDFWVPGGAGLGGNNGVLSLFDRPGGSIMDGVLYSNRSSSSDTQYRGFGSADCLERADELAREGGWKISSEAVRPEDAVSPEGSTATRSLCRSSTSEDTDTAADWHIVPTRGATFGGENSDEVYLP